MPKPFTQKFMFIMWLFLQFGESYVVKKSVRVPNVSKTFGILDHPWSKVGVRFKFFDLSWLNNDFEISNQFWTPRDFIKYYLRYSTFHKYKYIPSIGGGQFSVV